MLTKSEMRQYLKDAEREFKTRHPIIPVAFPSATPDQQALRIKPGFKNNAEPKGVYARLDLYAIQSKNARVMGTGRRTVY